MLLNYFALIMLVFVSLTLFYGVIAIHDIPYEIAKKRNHPHQDAIHAAGWVSLFTLHALWPFLWIWATLWRDDRGWGFAKLAQEQLDEQRQLTLLTEKVSQLEQQLSELKVSLSPPTSAVIADSLDNPNNNVDKE